jgi:hypothetical protein
VQSDAVVKANNVEGLAEFRKPAELTVSAVNDLSGF